MSQAINAAKAEKLAKKVGHLTPIKAEIIDVKFEFAKTDPTLRYLEVIAYVADADKRTAIGNQVRQKYCLNHRDQAISAQQADMLYNLCQAVDFEDELINLVLPEDDFYSKAERKLIGRSFAAKSFVIKNNIGTWTGFRHCEPCEPVSLECPF